MNLHRRHSGEGRNPGRLFWTGSRIKSGMTALLKILLILALTPNLAFAAADTSTGFLFFLSVVAGWLDSAVAHWIAIIGVAFSGFTIAFGDFQSGGARGLKVGVGVAIAFGASSLIATIFPSAGAVIGF